MESFGGIAQVQFASTKDVLCGPITTLDRSEIRIALPDMPNARVLPGDSALLVLAVNHALFRARAHSLEQSEGKLRLALDTPVERIRRRRTYRHACNLEAAVRALDSGGGWIHGVAFEIGYGGISLLLQPRFRPGERLEMQFSLPETASGLLASARLPVTTPNCQAYHRLSANCIGAIARVVTCRATPQGHDRLGLAFVSMQADDQMHLFTCTAGKPGETESA